MHRILTVDIPELRIDLPASKSVTHRILILAALNQGKTEIFDALKAQDTGLTSTALSRMGADIEENRGVITVKNPIGSIRESEIFLGNSGSSARFLLPLGAHLDKPVRFYGDPRLHERPFSELFSAMADLGVKYDSQNNTLPARIYPAKMRGGKIAFEQLPSSQVITALMMSALWMQEDLFLKLPAKTPSLPYIKMTYNLMKRLGLEVEYTANEIRIGAHKPEFNWSYSVEKDLSASSYWVIFSLITGKKVILPGLTLPSLQGDERIFEIAEEVGARVMLFSDRVEIEGMVSRGICTDCSDIPDLVPALSVLALFSPKPFELKNIKHLEYKESNRVEALRKNIAVLGGRTAYSNGNLTVSPVKKYRGGIINTFRDHRIAMSFAIAGTRIPDILIEEPDCVGKSYPQFWEHFKFWESTAPGES